MPQDPQLPSEAANTPTPKPGNKKLGIIAAVGGILGIGVYLYAKNKSSSASGTASANPTIVLPSGTADTANSSVASSLLPYLQSIGASLNTLSNQVSTQNQQPPGTGTGVSGTGTIPTGPTTPSTPANPLANETQQGAGYWAGSGNTTPIAGGNGQTYQYLSSWNAAQNLLSTGQTLYYQPTPGNFAPTGPITAGGPLGSNTPLYVQDATYA